MKEHIYQFLLTNNKPNFLVVGANFFHNQKTKEKPHQTKYLCVTSKVAVKSAAGSV
jgi:hypothetical protein